MFDEFINFVRDLYGSEGLIPLHEPTLAEKEKKYLIDVVNSSFVSSIGKSVTEFEKKISAYTGIKHAVAVVNGTSALHLALKISNVEENSEVITQSLSFVATCNAIRYCNAYPAFLDIDRENLTVKPETVKIFLNKFAEIRKDGHCWNKKSNRRISALLLVNTYGFPTDTLKIKKICSKFKIPVIEDCAESLGSFFRDKHCGINSDISTLSFNGNKIITTGGGGMILTNNSKIAKQAKHLSTTARISHRWKFAHDQVGYNYRMPNLNAALGLAQLQSLQKFLKSKRLIAKKYQKWGEEFGFNFVKENEQSKSNYWLNCLILKNKKEKESFIKFTQKNGIMTRPTWTPMHKLKIFKRSFKDNLKNTEWISDRLVNVPSSPKT